MNVFVLCTGRCGSTTFIHACSHITNYTAAHESRSGLVGADHFAYPRQHIEADNRLSWFLGRLDEIYGDNAIYVHMVRDRGKTVQSLQQRFSSRIAITYAHSKHLLRVVRASEQPYKVLSPDQVVKVCEDYYDTVNSNIAAFLKDKTRKMTFRLENANDDFRKFWDLIGAEGDYNAAVAEWNKTYNASRRRPPASKSIIARITSKTARIIKKFPSYLKQA